MAAPSLMPLQRRGCNKMATGPGIVAFNGVGLDNADFVFRLAGGGENRRGSSRVIDLGGGGVFDPDAGVAAPRSTYTVTQPYRLQAGNATVSAKAAAIRAQWLQVGTCTKGDGSTFTGRLIDISENEAKPSQNAEIYILDITCTWEVMPPVLS